VVVAADPDWDNTFIDGRILFEGEDYDLVFPFMGYLGDWSIYSEEDTMEVTPGSPTTTTSLIYLGGTKITPGRVPLAFTGHSNLASMWLWA